jgi:protein-S-isoprenylcysteine O-methyltransferase Ste14
MSTHTERHSATKRTFWAVAILYALIAFEFFYMASPFAVYFYSVYGPGLSFINDYPALGWLTLVFLPHIVVETSSVLLNLRTVVGAVLATVGFVAFCLGAGQVYYYKLARKGVVTGGIYNVIRHPQYASLAICSFGLLLLWPRYIVLLSFVAMLFAYYFLADVEESECEEKFGETYREYKNRTKMFVPFDAPLLDRLPGLPAPRSRRYLSIVALYVFTSVAAVGVANGLKSWSLNSLYALYSEDAVFISVTEVDERTLEHLVVTALADPEVRTRLARAGSGASTKFINYVLPAELYVSEIPINPVEGAGAGAHGEHFLPRDYDRSSYRIVFTRAEVRTGDEVEGKDILLNAVKRVPVVEVTIDLVQNTVAEIKEPPASVAYEGIPVPLY